jgi:hypothetical protein
MAKRDLWEVIDEKNITITCRNMAKRDLWEDIDEKNIQIDCWCIKNKWIFNVKEMEFSFQDLWHVVYGYSQAPGIDFN